MRIILQQKFGKCYKHMKAKHNPINTYAGFPGKKLLHAWYLTYQEAAQMLLKVVSKKLLISGLC